MMSKVISSFWPDTAAKWHALEKSTPIDQPLDVYSADRFDLSDVRADSKAAFVRMNNRRVQSGLLKLFEVHFGSFDAQRRVALASFIRKYQCLAANDYKLEIRTACYQLSAFDTAALCLPGLNKFLYLQTVLSGSGDVWMGSMRISDTFLHVVAHNCHQATNRLDSGKVRYFVCVLFVRNFID